MTELEIDQSHLPRVQEVCQCFAVLEDGVLAHNLQEQEIEQYYNSNVQKNQLVQKDIRIAKRLQDEEERQACPSQTARQLEEQDLEYARMIQDEIQQCTEEARRREEEDEELAKRIQEEEEMEIRQRRLNSSRHGNVNGFALNEGAGLWQEGACLELGMLQQVLLDEELARRLQEEEEQLHRKSRSSHSLQSSDPEEDFRAAQVAQDEEIARFMQRREMKSKWRSRDLEAQGSRREHIGLDEAFERGAAQEGKVQVQRERLDSEGLPSPSEERSPEHQTLNPVSLAPQRQPIRNIAEELDPTFKARRKETSTAGHTSSGPCQASLMPHRSFYDYMEEPMFIPPTRRQSDKSGRGKAKEKKEGCKQQ
ncbi:hypothetical protein MATL_G00106460 [Megalops atlanticus]|uniref:Coiled-coil domain-containing protein n=1 Tax=Megalops atlanticus TaxID=7932 RepID=A0A9D3Q017_MEGAT|nr:hypothetical protein MATL_G00106460 [Megalops atlanticus]